MSRVLVAYATRGGSTQEIAEAVADELRQTDHSVTIAPCDAAPDADDDDAVVIGSGLSTGRWLPAATRYLRRQATALAGRPMFMFQSGPCGPEPDTRGTPVPRAVGVLARRLDSPEPTTFAGRLDRSRLTGRFSRWLAASSPAGDFRDWSAIRAWARCIGDELVDHPGRRPDPPSRHERPVGTGSC